MKLGKMKLLELDKSTKCEIFKRATSIHGHR